ncbi:MAG TPA: RNA polymerase sigma factor [Thermoanaerobaculia bacterium]|jgi:RNA polymerase sigma-70 factor (ECF subfamily)|nr:RNA polymerase sigma factor [Thermoanaerobaculia bacterium]
MLSLVPNSRQSPGSPADPEQSVLAALDRRDPEEALGILMRAYGTAVYRFCRQMVGDDDLAQEVHQMTFVQAFEGLPKFGRRSSLRTWLFGIARHRCLDLLKMNRRRHKRFGPIEEAPDQPEPGDSVEDRLAERSRAQALESCLRTLNPRIRTAVLLRYQQGLSYPEIARISDEKAPALQLRVARALPVLRRCLEEKGMAP